MSRKRWVWIGVIAAVAIAIGVAVWSSRDTVAYAQIATTYAAKTTCSCINVSGRDLESCMADFPPDARGQIAVTQDGGLIRASVLFGVIDAEAAYEDGFGCQIMD